MISRKGWNRQRSIDNAKTLKERNLSNWFKVKIAGKNNIDFFYNGSGLFSASPFPILANCCIRTIGSGLVFQPCGAKDQTELKLYYQSLCSNERCVIIYTFDYLKTLEKIAFKNVLLKCLYYIQYNNGNTALDSKTIADRLLSKYESWF